MDGKSSTPSVWSMCISKQTHQRNQVQTTASFVPSQTQRTFPRAPAGICKSLLRGLWFWEQQMSENGVHHISTAMITPFSWGILYTIQIYTVYTCFGHKRTNKNEGGQGPKIHTFQLGIESSTSKRAMVINPLGMDWWPSSIAMGSSYTNSYIRDLIATLYPYPPLDHVTHGYTWHILPTSRDPNVPTLVDDANGQQRLGPPHRSQDLGENSVGHHGAVRVNNQYQYHSEILILSNNHNRHHSKFM